MTYLHLFLVKRRRHQLEVQQLSDPKMTDLTKVRRYHQVRPEYQMISPDLHVMEQQNDNDLLMQVVIQNPDV